LPVADGIAEDRASKATLWVRRHSWDVQVEVHWFGVYCHFYPSFDVDSDSEVEENHFRGKFTHYPFQFSESV
jgi:hypothetical protein